MKNVLTKFIYSIVILLVFYSCQEDYLQESTTGTLIGKVVASDTNIPLANVKIETSPVSTTVFTDENGDFTIDQINVAEYSVKAELKGYTTLFKPAVIYQDRKTNIVFELKTAKGSIKPPSKPVLISPSSNEVLKGIVTTFKWSVENPSESELTYTLKLYNDKDSNVEIYDKLTQNSFTHENLKLGVKYFWQIIVDDSHNTPVQSEVSSFQVYSAPKNNRYFYTKNIDGNFAIFSSDESNTTEFQLTSEKVNSFRPKKNPTANKVAYLQTSGSYTDLYTMDTDGTNKQKITSNVKPGGFNLNELSFSWPANSNKIYFPSFNKLYSISSNGQDLTLVYQTPDNSFISEVDVNIEYNTIALKTNNANGYDIAIYCIDLKGKFLFNVLTNVKGASSGLHLSNDATKILYSLDDQGSQNMEYRRIDSNIYLFDKATNKHTKISSDKEKGTNDLDPRFSPNEASVIFTNTSNDNRSAKNIYTKETNTATKTRVLKYFNAFMPEWI